MTPPFDLKQAHRWFAIELNNQAWDLLEAPQRSPREAERMIHAAHAACFHWLEAGDLLNHLRAQCLLATAYHKVGIAEAAVGHAQRCLALSGEAGDTQSAFDRATAHGCAAIAFASAGRIEDAQAEYKLALSATERFADPSEMAVFRRLYPAP
jgi:tetratricopeptide (TPR) repeat protein